MAKTAKSSFKIENAQQDDIWALKWTSNGELLSGSLNGSVKKWGWQKDKADRVLGAVLHSTSMEGNLGVKSIDTSVDGSITVVVYQDGEVRILETSNLKEISSFQAGLLRASNACISSNATFLVCGTHSGSIEVKSLSGETRNVVETNTKYITNCCLHNDTRVAAVGIDGYLNIVDISSNQLVHQIEAHALPARGVSFSHDGNILFTASDDRHVSVYDTRDGSLINSFSQPGMAYSVDVAPDRRHFITGCSDHSVNFWDLGMQRCVQSFNIHRDQVWSVQFDKSGLSSRFASGSQDGMIQFYEY